MLLGIRAGSVGDDSRESAWRTVSSLKILFLFLGIYERWDGISWILTRIRKELSLISGSSI